MAKDNINNTLDFAKAGYEAIGPDRIEQLELGNEPNSYPGWGDRARSYGPRDYVKEWQDWTAEISNALGIPLDEPTYQAVALTSPQFPPMGPWTAQNLFHLGLEDVRPRISSYSIH